MECPSPTKRQYNSRKAAKQQMARHRVKGRDKLSAYLCVCGSWHLGHLPPSVKQGSIGRREAREFKESRGK